jgi:hypothetical protein
MHKPMLDAFDRLPGVARVPGPVEVFGDPAKLHDEIAGQVLWLDFASFLAPEADESGFVIAHDDWGVGPADKTSPVWINVLL